jgi:2-oxoacid:acceptor oxidoreductase gamma subunit (pyruvate/2-ketoisovalerate family)
VVAADLLASAFAKEGKYVQAFPSFGPERRTVPLAAFVRIDEAPIRLRCEIYNPNHLIVLDPSLIRVLSITQGLKEGGWIVLNSNKTREAYNFSSKFRVAIVDASALAVKHNLGSRTSPIVNTAMLGAFAKVTKLVGIDAIVEAIEDGIPTNKEENVAAARESFNKA